MVDSITFSSIIGTLTIISNSRVISRIILDVPVNESLSPSFSDQLLDEAKNQLLEYLSGKRTSFDIPLDLDQLSGFQKVVLELTSRIPYGETLTYGQIASLLHNPYASRAVGSALARNPLPILIPCHRVISSSGHLTGYLGSKGIATKKWLLEREGHKIVDQKLG